MKLDIVAKLVQILKDAPDVGAIEIRRGLFGVWSSVRVSRAGHGPNTGEAHVVVAHPAAGGGAASAVGPAMMAAPLAAAAASPLLEIKSPMVGTFYRSPEPGPQASGKPGPRVATGPVVVLIRAVEFMNETES